MTRSNHPFLDFFFNIDIDININSQSTKSKSKKWILSVLLYFSNPAQLVCLAPPSILTLIKTLPCSKSTSFIFKIHPNFDTFIIAYRVFFLQKSDNIIVIIPIINILSPLPLIKWRKITWLRFMLEGENYFICGSCSEINCANLLFFCNFQIHQISYFY